MAALLEPEIKQAMELVRNQLIVAETRLYEHVSATFRWLMATLFAGNGGAVIALIGSDSYIPGRLYALGWFAGGVILSLLMGCLSSFTAFRASLATTKARLAVDQSLTTGAPSTEAIEELLASQKLNWKTWFPSYAGGASLLFFILGIGTIAVSLIR